MSFGTAGVGNLVLPGALPGVTWSATWALPGITLVYIWGGVQNIRVPQTQTFEEKNDFHVEMLPGATPVVVTCLPVYLA